MKYSSRENDRGYQYSFTFEGESLEVVETITKHLQEVIQPLVVEMLLGTIRDGDPELEIASPERWLTQDPFPQDVKENANYANFRPDRTLLNIRASDVRTWIQDVCRAESEREQETVTWYRLEFVATRTLLYSDTKNFVVEGIQIPIEQREDGLWVSGPRSTRWERPPVHVCFKHHPQRVRCLLTVHWDHWMEQTRDTRSLKRLTEEILPKLAQNWPDQPPTLP